MHQRSFIDFILCAIFCAKVVFFSPDNCFAGYLYVSSSNFPSQIARVNKDGSGYTVLRQHNGPELSYRSLKVDSVNERIYFSDSNGVLNSMNLDGTSVVSIATGNVVTDFELDVLSQKIFYGTINEIRSIGLDGSNDHAIYSLPYGSGEIPGIASDLENRKIFGTRFGRNGASDLIFRLNIDGTAFETLIDFGDRIGKPMSTLADIEFDTIDGRIY